jgi:hypothetical protein
MKSVSLASGTGELVGDAAADHPAPDDHDLAALGQGHQRRG